MTNRRAQLFLAAGGIAGVGLPLVVIIDGATRPGYSLWRHGVSQLGTGDRAVLFMIIFVVGGILIGLFAVGVRVALGPARGAVLGAVMLGVAVVGFVIGGLVPTDPALGYPPGEATPVTPTVGAVVHQVAGLMIFAGLTASAFALAGSLHRYGRGWVVYARLTGAAIIVLAIAAGVAYRLDTLGVWRPGPAGLLEQKALFVGYVWLVATSVCLGRARFRPSQEGR